ncbi:MAG: hypothetical protein JO115_05830 [Pseudonocardiales bacterium]|nr:hypothetical protein [Pseudonocardiales bacterium]
MPRTSLKRADDDALEHRFRRDPQGETLAQLDAPAAVLQVPKDQSAHPAPEHDSAGEADSRPLRCALGTGGHRRRLPDPLAGWDLVGAVSVT